MSIRNFQSSRCALLYSIIRKKYSSSSRHVSVLSSELSKEDSWHSRLRCINKRARNHSQAQDDLQYRRESGSVSAEELEKFKQLSAEWWKPDGQYAAIRTLNKLRVPLIRDLLLTNQENVHPSRPLSNFKILDVGCGGGILAEPLARLGASVVAIDPLPENIEAARAHASNNKELKTLTYECTTIEEMCLQNSECFDLVVASEVIEHVHNPSAFLSDCCDAVKPGGHMVVTTINRNILSTLLVKYAAEYLFRIVPENTHDENKFITPNELTDMLRKSNMVGINFRGMMMNPLTNTWCWADAYPMNYACYAQKT